MGSPVVLSLLSAWDREAFKEALSDSDWAIVSADTLNEALQQSRGGAVSAAICDCVLADGHSWIDLLNELTALPLSRGLLVAARNVDVRLWAEVLNLGGWDVVLKP